MPDSDLPADATAAPAAPRPVVDEAKDYLNGRELTLAQIKDLVDRLKKDDRFGWARRVLAKCRQKTISDPALNRKFVQQHALCTYKDADRPVLKALDESWEILSSLDLATTDDQETLGIAGAICKRRWQATGQKDQLERSYRYYRRGFHIGPKKDSGYTAINAAFVLDQLADIEMADETPSAESRRAEARTIREAIVAQLVPLPGESPRLEANWWYLVTIAEAYFGLGQYDEAKAWLLKAKAVPGIADWEFRTTATQLATLYQLQQRGTPSPHAPMAAKPADVLDAFLESPAARESAFIGKVGLALSGGGFRASLFHIGVLARMAELDVLRRVEVLSCVSGGSIIGAHYYLQLRQMLQTTDLEALSEDQIRARYIELVQRVADDFLAGVQTNIRMRVFANPFALLRSIVSRSYSRTIRLGQLFEQQLFAKVWSKDGQAPDGPLLLKELRIHPEGASENFEPKVHNWRRQTKVPVLILNATTLNTGHAWQYTVSFMGESPWAIDPIVDGTNRLRRMYHEDAPPEHRATPLSQAVVASACVPGLFEPIRLDGLFQLKGMGRRAEPLVVRQVDGGVHDNQGIASLFEQGCSVVLVSDASGQTAIATDPGGGTFAPLMRSNSVLMERVRQEQYARLDAMEKGGLLKGTMFIHLKKDLDVVPVDWVGCEEPRDGASEASEPLTEYGIRKEVQALLAGIRTDLDSFSDVEAYALMASGYRMVEHYLPKVEVLPTRACGAGPWKFLDIERVMRGARTTDSSYRRLLRLLGSAGSLMFRVWRQSRVLLLTTSLIGLGALGLILRSFFDGDHLFQVAITVRWWMILVALLVAVLLAVPTIREHVARISVGLLTLVLWIPAQFHLWVVDPVFLWLGRLKRLR